MPRFPLFLLPLTLLAAGCNQANAGPDHPQPRPAPPVYVEPVGTRTVLDRIRTVGQLEPDEAVRVSSEIKAVITGVHVDDGDHVTAGQVLFRLEDTRAKAELAEAEARVREIRANLVKATDDLDQDKKLLRQGIVEERQVRATQSAYDALVAVREAAEARVVQLREGVNDTVVRAPFDGVIGERLVYTGDYVEDGDPLVEVLRIDPLALRFSVSERAFMDVRRGARVDFLVPGMGDEVFHGEIYYIAPEADVTSRNVAVKAHVPNTDGRLRPGFFIKLQVINRERPNQVVVPESAVVFDGGSASVYVVIDGKIERRDVELGLRVEDTYFEVVRGVDAGEMLAVRGQYGLASGIPVTIVERGGGHTRAPPGDDAE